MTTESVGESGTHRRTLLRRTTVAAAVHTAASLPGGLPSSAAETNSTGLPDHAPVPSASVGPALNADGYFVGQIKATRTGSPPPTTKPSVSPRGTAP